jgi:hypothetical protein
MPALRCETKVGKTKVGKAKDQTKGVARDHHLHRHKRVSARLLSKPR